jgi:hypothetical protein
MRLDLVHIIEELGIDSAKFDEWKDAVLGKSEEQLLDGIPPELDDSSQDSECRK